MERTYTRNEAIELFEIAQFYGHTDALLGGRLSRPDKLIAESFLNTSFERAQLKITKSLLEKFPEVFAERLEKINIALASYRH